MHTRKSIETLVSTKCREEEKKNKNDHSSFSFSRLPAFREDSDMCISRWILINAYLWVEWNAGLHEVQGKRKRRRIVIRLTNSSFSRLPALREEPWWTPIFVSVYRPVQPNLILLQHGKAPAISEQGGYVVFEMMTTWGNYALIWKSQDHIR